MNKTLMKVLILVLLIIAAVLVIVLIQIILPNNTAGDPDPVSPSASSTVSPSSTTEATPSESEEPSPSPSPSDAGLVVREEGPDGVTYTVTVPGSYVTYSLGVDESVFKYDGNIGGDKFISLEDESEFLQISFHKGTGAVDLAPSFLDTYIDYTEFEQSGLNYIDGTEISGETVSANDGKTQMTAWLVNTDQGVLAVVVSYSLSDETQLPELEKMLSMLAIKE